jgi:hypothetical protein
LVPRGVGREDQLRALREAKAHAALDSRLSNRRQRTQGSEFRPLGHLRHHRRSRLATDKVLRNDSGNEAVPTKKGSYEMQGDGVEMQTGYPNAV